MMINRFIFSRTRPANKMQIINNADDGNLLNVTERTLIRIIKEIGYGNKAKGVVATAGVNNFANQLIKEWLIKPVPTIIKEDGEDKEITISNLFFIRNRALLKELILFNPDINVDRVRALGMVMLYRQEFMILYGGDINANKQEEAEASNLANDDFFTRNYDLRFNRSKFSKIYTS